MPRRERKVGWPPWVENIDDACLRQSVKEALDARDFAVDQGAPKIKPCSKVFEVGDETLDAIEFGRVTGPVACRKATVAARKFNTAGECAMPTARRR